MNDNSLIEFTRQTIPDLIALYRFGSQAKGSARPESDVDLAVLAHHPIPALRLFELAQELAAQLHRNVDLLDLRSASTVMRMQVISTENALPHRMKQPVENSKCMCIQIMPGSTRNGVAF